MKIQSIKKVKGAYEIIFDNEIIKYHEEVIIKYNLLRNNIEVSEEVYNNSLLDNRYFFAKDRAIKYLCNLKFKSQVKEYLLKTEENHIVNQVVTDLEKYKILNDYYTSSCYIASKYNKGYGSKELIKRLRDFKVCSDDINKLILENKELEIEGLNKYYNKLLNITKSLNKRDLKKKIENKLVAHGYLFEDINNILNYEDLEKEYSEEILDKYFEKAIKKYVNELDKYIQEKKIINFLMIKGFDYNLIKDKINIWKES